MTSPGPNTFMVIPGFTLAASPSAITVASGRSVAFNAMATGTPAPTYQWTLNSTTIPGATAPPTRPAGDRRDPANAGTYLCTAINSQGSAATSATLTVVTTPTPGYLDQHFVAGGRPAAGILIAGFAVAGSGTMDLLLRAGARP